MKCIATISDFLSPERSSKQKMFQVTFFFEKKKKGKGRDQCCAPWPRMGQKSVGSDG